MSDCENENSDFSESKKSLGKNFDKNTYRSYNYHDQKEITQMFSNLDFYLKSRNNYSARQTLENFEKNLIHSAKVDNVLHMKALQKKCVLPTPDILIKNQHIHQNNLEKLESGPDLLKSISPNFPIERNSVKRFYDEAEGDFLAQPICYENSGTLIDDVSVVPVDIIGDFGEEVKRELDLLVSSYNSKLNIAKPNLQRVGLEKIFDADLSSSLEQVSTIKFAEDFSQFKIQGVREAEAYDYSIQTVKEIENETNTEFLSVDLLNSINQNAFVIRISGESRQKLEQSNDFLIETNDKLVKDDKADLNAAKVIETKYQKCSYDERLLPPIGIDISKDNAFCAWFEKTETSCNDKDKLSENISQKQKKRNLKSKSPKSAMQKYVQSRPKKIITPSSNTNQNIYGNEKKNKASVFDTNAISDRNLQNIQKCKKVALWAEQLKPSNKLNTGIPAAEQISYAENGGSAYIIDEAVSIMKTKTLCQAITSNTHRQNEREKIRRRLAMGPEDACKEKYNLNFPKQVDRKSHRQLRFKNRPGNYFQVGAITDISSDTESHSSDSETCPKLSKIKTRHSYDDGILAFYNGNNYVNPVWRFKKKSELDHCSRASAEDLETSITDEFQESVDRECEFFTKQARLQIETTVALAQAKSLACEQIETEKQNKRISPITAIIRDSLKKIGILMAPEKRHVSRQMLTIMNTAQLQIIVNELHTKIEDLNDCLVKFLMDRDDLYMEQDAMLVEVKDLKSYFIFSEYEKRNTKHKY